MVNDEKSNQVAKNEANSPKRGKLIVNKRFQWKLIWVMLTFSFLGVATLFALTYRGFQKLESLGMMMGFYPHHVYYEYLQEQKMTLILNFASILPFILIGSIFGSLVFTNRIAGPIHRLLNHIEEYLQTKQWKDLKFRDDDYFPELAEGVCKLVKDMKSNSQSSE